MHKNHHNSVSMKRQTQLTNAKCRWAIPAWRILPVGITNSRKKRTMKAQTNLALRTPMYFLFRLMLVLLTCLWCLPVLALTPGPILIHECPGCRQPLTEYTIGSGNSFGAKFWTDGQMLAPMLPDRAPVVKCPKCSQLLWMQKATELGRIDYSGKQPADPKAKWNPKWDNAPKPAEATEKELLKFAAAQKNMTTAEQIIVRRRAWWLANDGARNSRKSPVVRFSEAQVNNLKALYLLLDEKKPDDLITKAEIARELEDFKLCDQLLSGKLDGPAKNCADFIRALSNKKDRLVGQYPER
jgi:hypothetical protein